MKKHKLLKLALLVLAGLVVFKIVTAEKREGLAARYREHEISWNQVSQVRSVLSLLGEKAPKEDRALVDQILRGYILWDEAKAMGIAVSESEAVAALAELPLPDGSSSAEDYLRKLGGSLEGYLDTLKEQALRLLTVDRLREAMARDYAREHGLDLDLDLKHLPAEVSDAVNEKIDALVESHRDEIEYYF